MFAPSVLWSRVRLNFNIFGTITIFTFIFYDFIIQVFATNINLSLFCVNKRQIDQLYRKIRKCSIYLKFITYYQKICKNHVNKKCNPGGF